MAELAGVLTLPHPPEVDLTDLATARLARLRRALEAAPFDALVLTSPESVTYATGYRSVGGSIFRGHRMAAVVTPDECWLVAPAADSAPAAESGVLVDRIVPFGRFFFESADASQPDQSADRHADLSAALDQALREVAVPAGTRWGVDAAAEPQVLAAVTAAYPGAVEASDWAAAVRACKLPDEVALLAYAAQLAETGIATALADAAPGATEAELASRIATTMVAGGADPRFVVATVGDRTALADAYPTQRAWRPGELARFDVGCVYAGYWSDMARTAVLGEPDTHQADRYAALLAGQEEQLTTARAGVSAGDMFDAAVRVVEAHGLRPYRRHHCGHGIGLAVYEPPIISPGVETLLQSGMTFSFETPYYEIGWGGMMVEDTVVVTDTGVDMLTQSPRDLLVVGG